MSDMRRSSDRIRAQVPVRLHDGGAQAMTLDLSATGLFLVTDAVIEIRKTIRFSIEFENNADPHVRLFMECFGEVARVEQRDGKTGLGIRITEYKLERRDRRSREGTVKTRIPERRRQGDSRKDAA